MTVTFSILKYFGILNVTPNNSFNNEKKNPRKNNTLKKLKGKLIKKYKTFLAFLLSI